MTMTLDIRDITDADIAEVIALWHAVSITRPWNDPAKDIAFARRDAHSTVSVAERDGHIAATRKADLWRSPIGTAMSFAIFASWRRLKPPKAATLAPEGRNRRLASRQLSWAPA